MIRINLLPASKRAAAVTTSGSAQLWGVVYLVGVGLTIMALLFVYYVYDGKLQEQNAANAAIQRDIDDMRARSRRLEEVRAELERSRQLEQVVEELNRARSGPIRVMMELSNVLSTGVGPTIAEGRLEQLRQSNPLAGFNPSWDVRRLSIDSFVEQQRTVTVRGKGRTNEDVAEFLRRLSLSELFSEVTLMRTEAKAVAGVDVIEFELTCKVTY